MSKPTPVTPNSAAGVPHPDDPTLRIPQVALVDAGGVPVSGGSHAYAWVNGLLSSDTWTTPSGTFIKNFNYNNGVLVGETDWVKQ